LEPVSLTHTTTNPYTEGVLNRYGNSKSDILQIPMMKIARFD
jgi:hypothetical protein